jgi:CRISPR type III-B/RAMP module RAMP protein Cmr6
MLAVTKPVQAALARCDAWQLRLDKFSFQRDGDAAAKTASLKAVRECYAHRSFGHLAGVCRSRQRLIEMLERQHWPRFATIELVLESKLLLHLGRASVLENVGLCADRTTGLPFIPGTALKGVLSTWSCWEANQQPDGSFKEGPAFLQQRKAFGGLAQRVFGDDSEDGSECAGEVVFVGGFPVTPPNLGLDIVNPHHEPNGQEKQNLTPNAFLCVEPGTKWTFAFYVRSGAPDAAKLLETTSGWLTQALTQLGIGAKIAAGYGRFRILNQTDAAAQAREAEKIQDAEATAAEKARVSAEKARQDTVARAVLAADYTESSFKNLLRLADSKGQWSQLQVEIERLRKPENAVWLQKFKDATKSKDWKDLRKQPWYPT